MGTECSVLFCGVCVPRYADRWIVRAATLNRFVKQPTRMARSSRMGTECSVLFCGVCVFRGMLIAGSCGRLP
jgi:hypothetical protein